MPIKAVFSVLDGTLLNPDHLVSDYTISMIQRLKAAGVFFIVATGRPYPDVFKIIEVSKFEPDFIITSNGARAHDGKDHALIIEHNIDTNIVRELTRIIAVPSASCDKDETATATASQAKCFSTSMYRTNEWVVDYADARTVTMFRNGVNCIKLGDEFYKMNGSDLEGVHQMGFIGDHDVLVSVYAHLNSTYGGRLDAVFPLPYIIDCVSAGVSKGAAMREVAKKLNVQMDEIACFGDGMNDQSMLELAGKAFVMENAVQDLKDAVPSAEVIGLNSEDAVARKLEEMFFQ